MMRPNASLARMAGADLSTRIWLAALFGSSVLIAWLASRHVVLWEAWSGFSPVGMMHPVSAMPGFATDFPNGEAQMMTSLIGRAYRLLGLIGVSDRVGAMTMIWLEVVSLMAGAVWLARCANPHLPRSMAYAAGILFAASALPGADFGRWFYPFYGSVYNFAIGAGLAALAAVLSQRMVLAGALIGIAATIHPIIAFFFGLAMAAAALTRWRDIQFLPSVIGAGTALALAGGWFAMAYGRKNIGADNIDPALFVTLTRLMSFHWFPMRLDVFADRAWEVLLPFTALMALWLTVTPSDHADANRAVRQLWIGAFVVFAVSLFGVWVSEHAPQPVLIKLALHRGSLICLLLASAVVVPRLVDLVMNAPFPVSLSASALLMLPFVRPRGLPITTTLVFVVLVALLLQRSSRRFALLALAVAAAVLIGLVATGHGGAIRVDANQGMNALLSLTVIGGVLVLAVARFTRVAAIAAVALFFGAAMWSPVLDRFKDASTQEPAEAYLAAQLWARDNTPNGSLFMVEPVQAYAWRQYSERPSFGTVRSWLYSGWIYDTDPAIMREGLRRAALLGIGPDDFIDPEGKSVGIAFAALLKKADGFYNTMDAEALHRFAVDNQIAYFVFDKTKRGDFAGLDVVYDNARFVIVKG